MGHVHSCVGLIGASLACATAVAGPDWNEGGSDAGSTLGSQRIVSSAGGASGANSTRGATSLGLGASDLIDLIEVNITVPGSFKFTPQAFTAGFDPRLFLFRGSGGTSNPLGEPLLCIDNVSATASLPAFDNTTGAMDVLFSEMGESFTPGRYLIAITGTGVEPMYTITGGGSEVVFSVPSVGMGKRRTAVTTWFWPAATSSSVGQWQFGTLGVRFIAADACDDAEFVFGVADRPVDNVDASDTVGLIDQCAPLARDVWYRLFLDCGGTVSISTCGLVTFDSVIEVYTGTCDALVLVACNDDMSGCSGHSSGLEFSGDPCASGEYLVRVGSYLNGPGGTGLVRFECVTPPPSADLNGDGTVNGSDMAILLGQWN